jgi:23S rRNA (uridine2552-2'-O)-methyltransferase
MAPNTSGVAFKDAYLSYELCLMALDIAKRYLRPGGNFVAKTFQGEEVETSKKELRQYFNKVEHYVPPATREGSKELYLVAIGCVIPAKEGMTDCVQQAP